MYLYVKSSLFKSLMLLQGTQMLPKLATFYPHFAQGIRLYKMHVQELFGFKKKHYTMTL